MDRGSCTHGHTSCVCLSAVARSPDGIPVFLSVRSPGLGLLRHAWWRRLTRGCLSPQAPAGGGPAVQNIFAAGHPQPFPRALRHRRGEPPGTAVRLPASKPAACEAGECALGLHPAAGLGCTAWLITLGRRGHLGARVPSLFPSPSYACCLGRLFNLLTRVSFITSGL